MPEKFLCLNCGVIGELTIHGACASCYSQQVVHTHQVQDNDTSLSVAAMLPLALSQLPRNDSETLVDWANRFLEIYLPRA